MTPPPIHKIIVRLVFTLAMSIGAAAQESEDSPESPQQKLADSGDSSDSALQPQRTPSDSEVKAVLPVFKSAVPVSKTPTESTERMATPAAKSGEPEFFISAGEAAAIRRLLRTGSVEQVEIAIETIVPQPLPETHMAPISLFEPIPTGPLLPVATPKGDSQ